jgi:hypothetical protein
VVAALFGLKALYLFPWYSIDQEISFGDVSIGPWDAVPIKDDDVRQTVEHIVESFRLFGDEVARPTLIWRTGSDRIDVPQEDAELLSQYACQLAFACIAENEYFSGEPISSAHLASYYIQFAPGETPLGLAMRRRDGHYLNRRTIEEMKITVPLAASVPSTVEPQPTFLDALTTCCGSSDPLDLRIRDSLPFFLMANNLSELTPALYDVVFLGSAFERLFEIEMPGIAKKLADHLANLFGAFPHTSAPSWTDFRGRAQTGVWLERWVSEFYDYRSSIHPSPPRSNLWDVEMHALISTVIYSLAVKLLLEQAGRYQLTSKDILEMTALDGRLAIDPHEGLAQRWHRATREAKAQLGQ